MTSNGNLPASELRPVAGGGSLAPDAAAAWNALAAHIYEARGVKIAPNGPDSTYRTLARQQYWRDYWCSRGLCGNAAVPGTCIEVGAAILTDSGLLPIEQVAIGDRVMTHKGRWRRVTDTRRFNAQPTMKVACVGHPGIYATPEHRWFAFDGWTQPKGIAHAGRTLDLRETRDLAGNLLASPYGFPEAEPPADYELTPDFLHFCGRYVADGSFHNRGGPGDEGIIYARTAKAEAVLAVAGRAEIPLSRWRGIAGEGTARLRFNGELARWLAGEFGSLSTQRTIPAWLLSAPAELRHAFLDGYLAGDGCWNPAPDRGDGRKRTPHYAWSTSSRCLAVGIVLLAQSLGMHAALRSRLWPEESIVKGRRCRPTAESWQVAIYPQAPHRQRRWLHEGFVVSRARVSEAEPRTVYDLTVDEDESFIADGLVSHNSNHGLGLAVDTDDSAIINATGAPYGWQKAWSDAQNEPWHFRYTPGHYSGPDPGPGYTAAPPAWYRRLGEQIKQARERRRSKKRRRKFGDPTAKRRALLHRQIQRLGDQIKRWVRRRREWEDR